MFVHFHQLSSNSIHFHPLTFSYILLYHLSSSMISLLLYFICRHVCSCLFIEILPDVHSGWRAAWSWHGHGQQILQMTFFDSIFWLKTKKLQLLIFNSLITGSFLGQYNKLTIIGNSSNHSQKGHTGSIGMEV